MTTDGQSATLLAVAGGGSWSVYADRVVFVSLNRPRTDFIEDLARIVFEFMMATQRPSNVELACSARLIAEQPAIGSPRHAHELGIPGQRSRLAGEFPYLIFYVERETKIDVWRVLHRARDIPTRMGEPHED